MVMLEMYKAVENINLLKDDTNPKGGLDSLIKFSCFYLQNTLECFLCTVQIGNEGHQA